jgi:hypothetical protein
MPNSILKTCLIRHPFLVILAIWILAGSCQKNDGLADTSNFTWTYGTKTFKANLDTAYISSMPGSPLILAGLGAKLNTVWPDLKIHPPSFQTGSYDMAGTPTTCPFYYLDPSFGLHFCAISGTLNITNYNNNRISGNFSVTLYCGIVTGSFTNVPVRD